MQLPNILNVSIEFSPKLGVRELPQIDKHHESNVGGLYIVGDLADAPIIKVALRQGFEVAQHIAGTLGQTEQADDIVDVLIIGAGPAGIGAALALEEAGRSYVIIEREMAFATIQNFPKAKLIFSEPRTLQSPGNFWFEDATKEELVERWHQALEDHHKLHIQQPEEVVNASREGALFTVRTKVGEGGLRHQRLTGDAAQGAENTYRARRVILAAGKRGQVRRLGVEGETLPHVHHALKDPTDHAGKRVVVVGGGDSAVEAATAIARAGGQVTLSYRGDGFHRTKQRNRALVEQMAADGALTLALQTQPVAITASAVSLQHKGGEVEDVPADDVLVFIGTKLPLAFLRRLGVKMQGDMDWRRALWITTFAAITWCFYVLKSGTTYSDAAGQYVPKRAYFPFGPDHVLGWVPDLIHLDLGFRTIDGSFWGTALYSALILGFGIRGWLKYPSPVQKKRYVSLITFQLLFLFGIPELLAPLVIHAGGEGGFFWNLFGGDRGWKFYGLSVPWPLNIWGLIDAPSWSATGSTTTVVLWLLLAAAVPFVALPLYIRKNGERFCSYLCGCGGLAETLGDFWRHLAPRGRTAKQAEWAGRIIYLLAIPTTLLILSDAWGFLSSGALLNARSFAEQWYTLMVDFALASVIGVALYPYFGNRVWCRFFCPLRAYMEVISARISKVTIRANDKCIGCNECTRYCQMGIDVQRFAQTGTLLHNGNSSCIQCGICIQVCPMEVLSIDANRPVGLDLQGGLLEPPKASWERA